MTREINESVDVVAAFTDGKILPIMFSWENRRYNNLKVASSWDTFIGEAKQIHISVIADTYNLFELCLNTRNLNWSLIKVYHG
jgi:hypothetical protein